jgi:nickel-type superoxide dismutase maturation protease
VSKAGKVTLIAAAAAAVAWRRWKPFTVAVEGESMRPALEPGDCLLAVARTDPRRGSMVVVEHPLQPGVEMVKQVDHLPGDRVGGVLLGGDELWLTGANPSASTDSRTLGPISRRRLRGVVVLRYRPLSRFGPIRSEMPERGGATVRPD